MAWDPKYQAFGVIKIAKDKVHLYSSRDIFTTFYPEMAAKCIPTLRTNTYPILAKIICDFCKNVILNKTEK